MQIAVISLAGQLERRRQIAAQFAGRGLDWRFFDGIRVSQFPPEYDAGYRRRWFGFDLGLGELGCFLSHRALWRECGSSSDRGWCILEDDIQLLPGFAQALGELEQRSGDWDVVRLMGHMPRRGWAQHRLPGGWALQMHPRQPGGTHGYVITPAAARRMWAYTRRIYEPVDNALDTYWRHRLNIFCLAPPVIALAPGLTSTIAQRGTRRRPRWPGLKRDLRKGFSLFERLLFNQRHYGRWR